jgi:hypothetical protein
MIEVKKPNSYDSDRFISIWHSKSNGIYSNGKFEVSVSDTSGGCGLVCLYNWSIFTNKDTSVDIIKETIEYIQKCVRANDAGAIICQVGKVFYNCNFTKALEELGYTYEEYINYRHNPKYKQRLYMKKL